VQCSLCAKKFTASAKADRKRKDKAIRREQHDIQRGQDREAQERLAATRDQQRKLHNAERAEQKVRDKHAAELARLERLRRYGGWLTPGAERAARWIGTPTAIVAALLMVVALITMLAGLVGWSDGDGPWVCMVGVGLAIFSALLAINATLGHIEYTLQYWRTGEGLDPLATATPVATTPGRCANCEYDLTGNISGVCPECGTPTG
jgi:hypothetical protein